MIQREIDHHARQAYVRRVARAIARGDRQLADDLEQDAMMISLSASPDNPNHWRGWLRSITRNTLRYQAFRDAQRPLHTDLPDDSAAPSGPVATQPDQVAASNELTGKLGELMAGLPETYRDVVRMRVLEELPPAVVAERLGITPEAVRTRHHRGLALLREDAERTLGKDSLPAWRGVLAMVFGAFRDRPLRSLLAVLAPVAIVTAVVVSVGRSGGPEDTTLVSVEAPSLAPVVDEAVAPQGRRSLDAGAAPLGVDVATALDEAPTEMALASASLDLNVEVVDTANKIVAGAEIFVRHGIRGRVESLGRTGPNGKLAAVIPSTGTWLAARHEAGQASRAVLANQPMVRGANGKVTLVLNDIVVSWFNISVDEDLRQLGATLYGARSHPETMSVYRLGEGLIGASTWLPLWDDGAGRFGVLEANNVFFVARSKEGALLWASDLHRNDTPLPDQIRATTPTSVRGRVAHDDGRPAAGVKVDVALLGRGNGAIASAVTDARGVFTVPTCPRTSVVFFGPAGIIGRAALADETKESVDVGTLTIHDCGFAVRVAGAAGGATVRALARKSGAVPSLLRPLGGDVLADAVLSPGEARASWEGLPVGALNALMIEGKAADGPRLHLEKRPTQGWGSRDHFVSVESALPSFGTALIAMDRLPIEARWIETETGLTMAAEVDDADGSIRSGPLPAGTWEVQVLDRFGVHQTSEARGLLPGATVDFGEVVDRSGTLRLSLPVEHDLEDRELGLVRVSSVDGRASKRVFIPPGEKLPAFLDLELPPLAYTITLLIDTRSFVAVAEVKTGQVQDMKVTEGEFILQLAGLGSRLAADPDLTVAVLDRNGARIGAKTALGRFMRASGEVVTTMPRVGVGQIVLESGGGALLGSEPVLMTDLGFQRVRF